MALTNSKLVEYLSNGYTIPEISKETGMNIKTLEKRILFLRRDAKCATVAHLVSNFMRRKIIN